MRSVFLSFFFELQGVLYKAREQFVGVGFKLSSQFYIFFKSEPVWNVHARQLILYPKNSLGFHLGSFLLKNKFEPQPRCEDHDVFHVLTGFSTDVAQEIAMQYWLWGNGKRSIYSALAMFVGIVFYPDQYGVFLNSYRQGGRYMAIHDIDYQKRLLSPVANFMPKLK
ncbi:MULTISPECIES: hypothetical protein [unclassified Halomonas]|uniref:hypothetical protein n=1 Tax=unclassified Halomonas TaxID=2609666 RepID=UPI0007D936A4|nr:MULTISPECIES: hypothetical protein [unclassified Halomonas]MBT2785305.1 hypothetical protein [Halomonas sp. ISL-106]MBT2799326.1 hypothetical protein [Halomonas sp. ISL-104]OAL59584.1 hypothetical protein A6R74_02815 [Halomonas sp. ALS9]